MVHMRRVNLVVFAALVALGSATGVCAPAHGLAAGSVSGVVRDTGGVPQIGAVVQLLRPDLTVLAVVYTDSEGWFTIPSVLPGKYALKAMGTSFLPSLRENVRVRTTTVVNLTLNTLYEAMQWLPSQPRSTDAQPDDWKWTLRSAANRPLLRWLEDGPLVVVSDGTGKTPKLKARLMATGQMGTFGESGERITSAAEETPSNSRELLARVDFAPETDGGMESMLGFRQDLGFAGSVQSVAAVTIHPEVDAGDAAGVDEAAIRSWEDLNLGDEFESEVGSTQVLAHSFGTSGSTVATMLPMVSAGYREGNSTLRYRLATALPARQGADETEARAWMPELSMRNGKLAMERGLHQEIGWERRTDTSGMSVVVFADHLDNPVVEAMTRFGNGGSSPAAILPAVLFDPASWLMRAAGPNFSTAGVLASVERRLPGGNLIRVSYANGDALVMASTGAQSVGSTAGLAQALAAVHPRRAQTYALSVSGTLDGTGTRWRASYRWQPEDTVTSVAPYEANAAEPYLNLHLRQPIRRCGDGLGGFEALLDVRNLLGQGYRPYLMSDGSLLVFAQQQRGFQGGLAFTF
jgi:hypothetical protein